MIEIPGNYDFYKFTEEIVKPITKHVKMSLANALLAHPDLKKHVKPKADVMISYSWQMNCNELFQSLASVCANEFIFLDCTVVNQHLDAGEKVPTETLVRTFGGAITDIGKVVFCFKNWRSF